MTPEERSELERIRRVTDMACSSHARLRDRFAGRALALDLGILAATSWLVALAFVDQNLAVQLTPFHLQPQIWMGSLGVVTFFLSVAQLRVDWKARSDAHARSMHLNADLKRELNLVLSRKNDDVGSAEHARVLSQTAMVSSATNAIPEADFLSLKRQHKLKVAVSRHLDDHPAASILLTKLKFFLRDNGPR
jgi:hypothetical protein